MNYYLLVPLLLLLIPFMSTSAPLILEPTFSRLSTENGLTQNTINSLLLDSEGFLWLGTSEGLNRFDGYTFEVFKVENLPGLLCNQITYLCEDKNRNLWIGTEKGINILDLETYKLISDISPTPPPATDRLEEVKN